MLNICLTFDHELFLGENFASEKEILIDTTERLLNVLQKYNISGTFFTDVCSIIRYKELGMNEYPDLMTNQLKKLVNCGQDVQLHIHANWLKSDYIDGKWIFDFESYRVQYFTPETSLNNNNWTMMRIITEGKALLEGTLKSEAENYSCLAFRAGGFSIQPEPKLIDCLIDNHIYIDSSVVPGKRARDCINYYDFRYTPQYLNWFISPATGINQIASNLENRKMYEVPVATYNSNFFLKVLKRKRGVITSPHRGRFINEDSGSNTSFFKKLYDFYITPAILSLDSCDAKMMYYFVKKIFKKYKCMENDVFISVICHPKLVNDDLLKNMEQFIKLIQATDFIDFCNFRDVYVNIKGKDKSFGEKNGV